MTDSPAFLLPIDPAERPILERLLDIRDQLSLLKQDRSTYVKSKDVITLYNALIVQVEQLNKIRTSKPDEQNRVDTVLDDCFQLISLFFLTIGRNHEAPAVYSAISTVKRLLDHLKEAGFYSIKDLESITKNVEQWYASVQRGKDDHSEQLVKLLEARINVCKHILQDLRDTLSKMDPEMEETHEKLVSILRSLSACNTRSKVSGGGCHLGYRFGNADGPRSFRSRKSRTSRTNSTRSKSNCMSVICLMKAKRRSRCTPSGSNR